LLARESAVMKPHVVFVCLGNICRSPLAEGAFRREAELIGLDAETDSAATRDWHEGKAPDRRSIAVARKNGVDISSHRARPLRSEDFARFTHIIGMDRANLKAIADMAPAGHGAHLSLLLDHAPGRAGQEIDDPWAGRAADFERCWAEVLEGVTALAAALKSH
jgi:protein-tyrosine phosphatase